MERKEIKRIIDTELNEIVFTDIMKKKSFWKFKEANISSDAAICSYDYTDFYDWRNDGIRRLLFFE